MGCALGSRRSTKIEPSRERFEDQIILLLLGTGNSGKSTVMKQMKILHKNGFTDTEKRHFIGLIVANLTQSMYAIIDIIQTDPEFQCQYKDTEKNIKTFIAMIRELFRGSFELNLDIIPLLRKLLQEPVILKCFKLRRAEIVNAEAVEYFFTQIDRICLPGYLPSNDDILHTRLPTSGVHEITFNYQSKDITMVDVGGQRTERNKWMHCFEGVTSIIYCASLTEYAIRLPEDPSMNAMQESLNVFSWVVNNVWFKKKSVLLFLNKKDLFEKLIEKEPMNKACKGFQGNPDSYIDSITYIKQMYLACDLNPNRKIYTHVTCATDTSNIKATFHVAVRSVMEQNLDALGLM